MTSFSCLKDKLGDVLCSLNERERQVLELRFGLGDGNARTLEEVGQQFRVTRERIRQIEAKALRKMRHPTRIRQLHGFLEPKAPRRVVPAGHGAFANCLPAKSACVPAKQSAGVQARVHFHDGDAGIGFAVQRSPIESARRRDTSAAAMCGRSGSQIPANPKSFAAKCGRRRRRQSNPVSSSRSSEMNCSSRALAGCSTGSFNFPARIFTGENCNLRSRPLGLSGCVTTAAMGNFPASFSRLARDNSGVPMKMILISFTIYDLRFARKLYAAASIASRKSKSVRA
jgi:hypothetical protein